MIVSADDATFVPHFGAKLCEVLGLDPTTTERITMVIEERETTVTIEQSMYDDGPDVIELVSQYKLVPADEAASV